MSLEKCRLPGFLTFLFGKAPSFLLICLIQTFALYFHHYILFAASVSVSFLCFSPFSLSPINFYFLYLANTDTETPPSPSSGGRRSGPAKPSLRAHNHVSASSDWIHASERQIYAERANWTPWPRFLCNLDNLICSIWWRYPQQKLNILRRVSAELDASERPSQAQRWIHSGRTVHDITGGLYVWNTHPATAF